MGVIIICSGWVAVGSAEDLMELARCGISNQSVQTGAASPSKQYLIHVEFELTVSYNRNR